CECRAPRLRRRRGCYHGRLCPARAKTDALFGHGSQVVEQRLETMDGQAIVGPLGAGFALCARGALGWRYHRGPPGLARGLVVIVEQQRGQGLAHVPLAAIRYHAEEHMAVTPLAPPVPS